MKENMFFHTRRKKKRKGGGGNLSTTLPCKPDVGKKKGRKMGKIYNKGKHLLSQKKKINKEKKRERESFLLLHLFHKRFLDRRGKKK